MCGMQGTVFCFLEGTKTSSLYTQFFAHPSGHCPSSALCSCTGSCSQQEADLGLCQVLCKEIAELNILFTSTLLQYFSDVFWLVSLLVVTACLLQHCRELLPLWSKSKPVCCSLPRGECFTVQCMKDRLLFK